MLLWLPSPTHVQLGQLVSRPSAPALLRSTHPKLFESNFPNGFRLAPPADSGLAAAALVSNPFCLTTASARLKRPWTMPWLHGLVLAQRVRAYAIRHKAMLDPSFRMTLVRLELVPSPACATHLGCGKAVAMPTSEQISGVSACSRCSHWVNSAYNVAVPLQVTILQGIGIHKWDETITCRLLNHADVAEYYQAAGTKQFILHFRTPSLFLISRWALLLSPHLHGQHQRMQSLPALTVTLKPDWSHSVLLLAQLLSNRAFHCTAGMTPCLQSCRSMWVCLRHDVLPCLYKCLACCDCQWVCRTAAKALILSWL